MPRVYDPIRSGLQTLPDPLPFDEQPGLLGGAIETTISARPVPANLASAYRFTGAPVDVHTDDEIVIVLPLAGSATVRAIVNVNEWRELRHASQGNLLSVSGGTALLVGTTHGNLLVGRTQGNRALIQANAGSNFYSLPSSTDATHLSCAKRAHSGGLLQRRLDAIRDTDSVTVLLYQRAPARPSGPTGVTFNGVVDISANTEGWLDYEPDISTDPLWIATATATYDDETATWTLSSWTVTSATSSGFDIEYSEHSGGPWVPSDDGWPSAYIRYRLADGTYRIVQLRRGAQRGLVSLISVASLGSVGQYHIGNNYKFTEPQFLVFESKHCQLVT